MTHSLLSRYKRVRRKGVEVAKRRRPNGVPKKGLLVELDPPIKEWLNENRHTTGRTMLAITQDALRFRMRFSEAQWLHLREGTQCMEPSDVLRALKLT